MNDIKYKVSVRLMTFNHELFIQEAMDSIMMQKTNFKVEVVIGDDFSTDKTLDIIKSYRSTDNIHIKILERRKGDTYWQMRQELGRLYNFLNIIENCTGEYIALLDGDDYWTDQYKLQKQVDALELRPKFIISSHDTKIVDKNGVIIKENVMHNYALERHSKEIIAGAHLPTNTVLYRNIIKKIPKEFLTVKNGDSFLFALLGQYGKAYYNKNVSNSGYRMHSEGVWSQNSKLDKLVDSYYTFLNIYQVINHEYKKLVLQRILIKSLRISKGYLCRDLRESIGWIGKSIKHSFFYIGNLGNNLFKQ